MIDLIEIQSLFKEIEKVSHSTRINAEKLGFNTTEIYEIELSVVEAVTNCIKHAYKGENDNSIKISFKVIDHILEIIITDYGQKWETFEQQKKKPSPFEFSNENLEEAPQDGMGLAILVEIMDEVEYQRKDDHNILILSKKLPKN